MTCPYRKYTYFTLEIDAIFFRNISVTRNPCKYRTLKAHLLTLHPTWQVAGGNWLLHCSAIAKAQPSKGNKAQGTIANASPWALDPVNGGIISISHTTEKVDKKKIKYWSHREVTEEMCSFEGVPVDKYNLYMDLSDRQSIPFFLKIQHVLWDPCHKAPLTQATHATLIQKTIATTELCHAQGCKEPWAQGTSSHKRTSRNRFQRNGNASPTHSRTNTKMHTLGASIQLGMHQK